ncbi:MAG: DUF89 family protein [Oscillospiraceae bacterium]|nr:DUF89 family protein [Oscillospiraceae bacterium]
MSIPVDTQCLQCYLKRNLDLVRPLGTEEKAMAFAKQLMQHYIDAPAGVSSPWFSPKVADLLHEMYDLPIDRFRQEKLESNRFVMERFEQIRKKVESAPDPVFAGLQFSILGNYLDFGALQGQVSFERLEQMLDEALDMELDLDNYKSLCRDLEKGRNLLYLTDNAGEIGFDRIFAEEIAKKYPHLSITFCVRGGIANNDATREDAATVGIPFPIIDNGNRIAGTQMDQLSEEAENAITAADVIIAKGMANTETMFGCGYNVYYAFLIKCQRFVTIFDRPMFTPMLVRESK